MISKEEMIQEVTGIIGEYTTRLTVRQVYYRLVAKHLIENKVSQYQRVVKVLRDARISGEIPFRAIEDRTRSFLGGDRSYSNEDDYFNNWLYTFRTIHEDYELPRWYNQEEYVEVWIEKQALAGVFDQITQRKNVVLAPCRGYPSITYLYEAAQRLKRIDKDLTILYFGDFDPSGVDIFRSIEANMRKIFGVSAEFKKIAITPEQIEKYDIPPMPTKTSDPRSANYIAEYGDVSSVELDAIEPDDLQELISSAIDGHFDESIHNEVIEQRDESRARIKEKVIEIAGEAEE